VHLRQPLDVVALEVEALEHAHAAQAVQRADAVAGGEQHLQVGEPLERLQRGDQVVPG